MWKVDIHKGQPVAIGDRLAIIESMKMEIPVLAPAAGIVADVFCAQGRVVSAGQVLFSIRPQG
jgi:urea carboxylase